MAADLVPRRYIKVAHHSGLSLNSTPTCMSSLSLSEILDRLPPQLKDLGPASLALGAGIVVFLGYVIKTVNNRRKMPPGPVGLPFIGNKHQMPPSKPWRKFEQLNKQYGR